MHDVRPFLTAPFETPGTLLYVGFRPDAHSWLDELLAAGNEVDVLEVWPGNCGSGWPGVRRFWVMDVRDVARVPERYDHAWWWHGPEHVWPDEFPKVFEALKAKAGTVAVASPWGLYEQGPHAGNPHERHLWPVYEADFQAVGLETRTDGAVDQMGSEIVGWTA